jgi:hypothetical protein
VGDRARLYTPTYEGQVTGVHPYLHDSSNRRPIGHSDDMPLFREIVASISMVPAALAALVGPCRRLRNRRRYEAALQRTLCRAVLG